MRDFLAMLSQIEQDRQDILLGSLVNSKLKVGIFIPAMDEHIFLYGLNLADNLKKQGMDIRCILCFDEVKSRLNGIKCQYELINLSNKDEIMMLDYILQLNINCVWTEWMYTYFEKIGIPVYFIQNDSELQKKRQWLYESLNDLYQCYTDFCDDFSRKTFLGVLQWLATGQYKYLRMADEPQYMLSGYGPRKGDIIIDGGAYDGKTAADFIMFGANVYAFEMDYNNFLKAKTLSEEKHFIVENLGLWSSQGKLNYYANESGSFTSNDGDNVAEFIDLDNYVSKQSIPRIDFIKLDVEGAELESLKGAKKIICTCKPRMSICAYHKLDDLYTLHHYIKKLRPDYEFAFRHYRLSADFLNSWQYDIYKHYDISMEISSLWEYVLYAR